MRILLVVIMMLFLASCAIFGPPTELDETKGMSADRIYALASEKLSGKDYEKAIGYLKKLESRFPNARCLERAQGFGDPGIGSAAVGRALGEGEL